MSTKKSAGLPGDLCLGIGYANKKACTRVTVVSLIYNHGLANSGSASRV